MRSPGGIFSAKTCRAQTRESSQRASRIAIAEARSRLTRSRLCSKKSHAVSRTGFTSCEARRTSSFTESSSGRTFVLRRTPPSSWACETWQWRRRWTRGLGSLGRTLARSSLRIWRRCSWSPSGCRLTTRASIKARASLAAKSGCFAAIARARGRTASRRSGRSVLASVMMTSWFSSKTDSGRFPSMRTPTERRPGTSDLIRRAIVSPSTCSPAAWRARRISAPSTTRGMLLLARRSFTTSRPIVWSSRAKQAPSVFTMSSARAASAGGVSRRSATSLPTMTRAAS